MVTFKVFSGSEARRFKLESPITYEQVSTKVASIYSTSAFQLKWIDSDGDFVTIANNDDLNEAVMENGGWNTTTAIKIHAISTNDAKDELKSETKTTETAAPESNQSEPEPEPKQPEPEPEIFLPIAHPNVICDGTNQPLVGTRYHKVGQDFDLCEEEFAKLKESEKQYFEMILRPFSKPIVIEPVVHYGITCDASNVSPIFGLRFHKIGEDYDLTQAEFSKLDEREKRQYEIFSYPKTPPVPYYSPSHATDRSRFEEMVSNAMKFLPNFDLESAHMGQHHMFGPGRRGGGRCRGYGGRHHGPRHGPARGCRFERGPNGRKWGANEVVEGDLLPAPTLKYGSFGPGVEQLQRYLIKYGFMDESAIKWRAGYYVKRTQAAIGDFQRSNKLSVEYEGHFCEVTRQALLAFSKDENKDSNTDQSTPINATTNPSSTNPNPSAPPPPPGSANEQHRPKDESAQQQQQQQQPEPEPVAEQPQRYIAELEALRAMGFIDDTQGLITLLDRFQGSVEAAIAELLK